MTTATFFVELGTQNPLLNNLFKAADLGINAVAHNDGSGKTVEIKWKKGEIVDKKRLVQTAANLYRAFKQKGFYVYDVRLIKVKGTKCTTQLEL